MIAPYLPPPLIAPWPRRSLCDICYPVPVPAVAPVVSPHPPYAQVISDGLPASPLAPHWSACAQDGWPDEGCAWAGRWCVHTVCARHLSALDVIDMLHSPSLTAADLSWCARRPYRPAIAHCTYGSAQYLHAHVQRPPHAHGSYLHCDDAVKAWRRPPGRAQAAKPKAPRR